MKMNIGKFSVQKQVVFGVITALSIAMPAISQTTTVTSTTTTSTTSVAQGNVLAETATVMGACGKLFDVSANAAGLTARERASIIQKNLDYAIIHAKNRTPSAVAVIMSNRNPVVTVDGFHIATADGNSAARLQMTQMQLAEKWADSIKFCLADAAAVDKYLSMLTGNYPTAVAAPRSENVAYAPAGMMLPVKLLTPIDSETSQIGDRVEAQLTVDVPLRTSQSATQYAAYLPCGTVACGQLVDASNSYLGKNAFGIRFEQLRTPDGEVIPINGHILGGVGTWLAFNSEPNNVEFGNIAGEKLSTNIIAPAPGAPGVISQSAVIARPAAGLLASKGSICGGWRGYPIGRGLDIPYEKLVFKRHIGVTAPCGEQMMLQLAAPTAIAVCTNCGSPAL